MRIEALDAVVEALQGITVSGRPLVVWKHVPRPGDVPSPAVAVHYAGATDTEMNMAVSVFVRASDPSAQEAQDFAVRCLEAVDIALDAAGYGPPGDTFDYSEPFDCWIGTFTIQYPRNDF